jgi:hypothetical protein
MRCGLGARRTGGCILLGPFLADRVALVDRGRALQSGCPTVTATSPQSARVPHTSAYQHPPDMTRVRCTAALWPACTERAPALRPVLTRAAPCAAALLIPAGPPPCQSQARQDSATVTVWHADATEPSTSACLVRALLGHVQLHLAVVGEQPHQPACARAPQKCAPRREQQSGAPERSASTLCGALLRAAEPLLEAARGWQRRPESGRPTSQVDRKEQGLGAAGQSDTDTPAWTCAVAGITAPTADPLCSFAVGYAYIPKRTHCELSEGGSRAPHDRWCATMVPPMSPMSMVTYIDCMGTRGLTPAQ